MAALTPEQRKVAATLVRVGRKKGAKRSEIIAAVMTGLTEANLGNPNYGDRDSVGWRQERSHYGSVAERLKVNRGAARFYDEIKSTRGSKMTPGQKAQAVQRSAFPERYDERRQQALDVIAAIGGKSGSYQRNKSRQNGRKASTSIPGVNNSPLRTQILQQYLTQRHDPSALLGLAEDLEGAQDIPGMTVPGVSKRGGTRNGDGRDVVTATGEPVGKLLKRAVKWDKAKRPYLWGGGHGSTAKPGDDVDCSGFWSGILKLPTPLTSGGFLNWGKPGEGRNVTIYTNDGHVLGKIRDPKTNKWRWYGTSRSNPGGGAGEISPPSASYLSAFQARHPG